MSYHNHETSVPERAAAHDGGEPTSARRRGTGKRSPASAPAAQEVTGPPRAFADSQRVRVKIRDRGRFSGNSAAEMDGKSGAVEKFSVASFNGDPPAGPAYLVRFNEPLQGWHAHQLPVEAFWFPPGDLEAT